MGNFPIDSKTTSYNTYDIEPTGVAATDTANYIKLVGDINSTVPLGKSCRVRIRDNGLSLKLSGAISGIVHPLLRGTMIYGETENARIEFSANYLLNWGGYDVPIDMGATMPSTITRGTMSAMAARTSRIIAPNISLNRDDWVLIWSEDNIPLSEVAPHNRHGSSWPVTVTATGGTYTVTINSSTSTSIAWNASVATIQAALEGAVGTGNVLVTGTSASYVIDMWGSLAVPGNTISVNGGSLTGGTISVGAETFGLQRAGELHRVEYATGSDYVLDGFTVDPLTTTPRIAKIQMLRNCGLRNITIGSSEVTNSAETNHSTWLWAHRCLGFRMEDVRVDETGTGSTWFQLCADSQINNFSGTYLVNNHRNYAVVTGLCNNFTFQDSIWHNTRHVFTTVGMAVTGSKTRYGTPRNIVVRNVDQHVSGDPFGNGYAGFDPHAEGWGIEFDRCRAFGAMYYTPAGGQEEFYAFSTRARNTKFTRCSAISNMSQTSPGGGTPWRSWYKNTDRGFRIMANDTVIDACLVDGVWQGVQVMKELTSPAFRPKRTIVRNTDFRNISGPVLRCIDSGCDKIDFFKNEVRDCSGYYATGNPVLPGAMIVLTAGTGHRIRSNLLDRGNNDYTGWYGNLLPTDVEFRENYCLGYTARFTSGTDKIGVRGDTGDPNSYSETSAPSFQSTYAALNYTS